MPSVYAPMLFRGQYFALGIVSLLAMLFLFKCLHFKRNKDRKRSQRVEDLERASLMVHGQGEYASLTTDNDLIDYDLLDL